MPVQSVAHWEEKARLAAEKAETMWHPPTRAAMLEIAQLYLNLAEHTLKLPDAVIIATGGLPDTEWLDGAEYLRHGVAGAGRPISREEGRADL